MLRSDSLDIRLIMTSNDLIGYSFTIAGDAKREFSKPGSSSNQKEDFLMWCKNQINLELVNCGTVICRAEDFAKINPHSNVTYLITDESPRLVYTKILIEFFSYNENLDFENDVEIHRKNPRIRIGENVFIGKNVSIGDGTRILHNVTIHSNTTIGEHCFIQSSATIGTEGLGLEIDPDTGINIKFPQLGGVILEDYVEVGPNSTIRRSALENTIVKKGTKIGSMSNVGHNCIVGENCILTCNVVVSGSSIIGNNVFLGVSSTVKNGKHIGDNATLGQGAVVVRNVPENETWVGNPAKKMM